MTPFLSFVPPRRLLSTLLTHVSHDTRIQTLTLNDVKTRNSLSLSLLQSLKAAFQGEENGSHHESLRAIIIRSADPRVFSGGHDLKELSSGNEKLVQDIFDTCGELTRAIRECPVPVIAAIDGVAAAAGCQLVAACDIAVATKKSSFSTPGASVGIFCSSPGVPLIRNANLKTSAYMLLTGKPINATQALQSGLISRLTEDTKALERELDEICKAIIDKPKGVIAMGKKFMYEQLEMRSYHEALVRAGDVMVQNLKYKDTKEGMEAFLKKKKPNWTHTHDKD